MSMSWNHPAVVLTELADSSLAGVWSLLRTAGLGAITLGTIPGCDDDLAMTYAALDLTQASGEIGALQPSLIAGAPVVDLGDVELNDRDAAVAVIVDLLDAAISRIGTLTGAAGRPMAELLCLARVQPLLLTAREKVAGGAW